MSLVSRTKLPAIPEIKDGNVLDVLRAIKERMEVREGMRVRGDPMDRVLTVRDAFNAGAVSVKIDGKTYRPPKLPTGTDIVAPPEPTNYQAPPILSGLTATGALTSIVLTWNALPREHNVAYVEIWRATVDNLGLAAICGTAPAGSNSYVDDFGFIGAERYYWVRAVSRGNIPGPYNTVKGAYGVTGYFRQNDALKIAKTAYTDDATMGLYIGNDAGTAKLNLGNATNWIKWTGAVLDVKGTITAESGLIGGWTIGATTLTAGNISLDAGNTRIQAGPSSGTYVRISPAGIVGVDSVLGTTFNLPTNGQGPTFSSGTITSTIYEIQTNSVLRTSQTVGQGTNGQGVLINDTGIKGYNSTGVLNFWLDTADGTLMAKSADIEGNITAGGLLIASGGSVRSGKTAYGDTANAGFWLGSDAGTPRFRIGNAGHTAGMTWDGAALGVIGNISSSTITGSTITGGTVQTAATGQRIVLSGTSNQAEFYGNRGDGVIEKLATIGITPDVGGNQSVGNFGNINAGNSRTAVSAMTYSGFAAYIRSEANIGLWVKGGLGDIWFGAPAVGVPSGNAGVGCVKGGDNGTNLYLQTAYAYWSRFLKADDSNIIGQAQLQNAAVGQANLKTATSSQSVSVSAGGYATIAPTGGDYTLAAFHGSDFPGISDVMVAPNNFGYSATVGFGNFNASFQRTGYLYSRYVQASPPYDLGDGEIPLFAYVLIEDGTGKVLGTSFAPDPPWMYHGPNAKRLNAGIEIPFPFMEAVVDPVKMAQYRAAMENPRVRQRRARTMDEKLLDMPVIPHPFMDNDLSNATVVMVNPVGKFAEVLYRMHAEAGEDLPRLMHEGHILVDNAPLAVVAPPGVRAVNARFKLT